MKNWRDISYLETGDKRQREVYKAIKNSSVLKYMAAFDPVVTGTYPIGIYLPGSDIDIVCEYINPEHFTTVLEVVFSSEQNFEIKTKKIRGVKSIIARFDFENFLFEIFGQAKPVEQQYAYRHMIIENRILEAKDDQFRKQLIMLKEKGLSTEEAFAFLLNINGDPYDSLLSYSF